MTASTSDHDLLIEIKTLVKSLTDTLVGYGKDIRALDTTVVDVVNRVVALETRAQSEDASQSRQISGRAVFWAAGGTLVLFASVLVTLLVRR